MKALNYKTIAILSLLVFVFLLGFSFSVQAYRISRQELNSPVSRYLRENYGVNSIEEYRAKLEQEAWLNISKQMEALASEYPEINFSQWRSPDVYRQYGTFTYQPPKITPQQPFYIALFSEPVTALQIFSLSGLGLIGLATVPPIRKSKRLKQALIIGIVVLCVFSVGYFTGYTVAQTGLIAIEPASLSGDYSYLIETDGTYVWAKSGKTGEVVYGGQWNAGGVSGTDACTVIQSAINALTSGGKIFIKAGTYTVTTWIDLGNKINIVLQGEGDCTRLVKPLGYVKAETYYGRVLNLAYANGITIKDIYIESTSAGADGSNNAIVNMHNANNCTFENVTLKQRDDGSGGTRGIDAVTGNNNVFVNCRLLGSGAAYHGNWGMGLGGLFNKVLGCYFEGWGHNAIMNGPNRGIIANSVFKSFYDDCIDLNGIYEVTIVGNVCRKEKVDQVGFFVSLASSCHDIVVADNVIQGINHGVEVTDSYDIVIVGNRFFDSAVSASKFVIVSGSSDGVLVASNYAVAEYLVSIEFSSQTILAKKILVIGNNLYGKLSPAYIAYINNAVGVIVRDNFGSIYGYDAGPYITEAGASDRNVIEGNEGHSWQYPNRPFKLNIQTVGANTVVKDNRGYDTENFKVTGLSVTVGTGGAYGSATAITTPSGRVTYPRVKITWGGTFGTDETVTVKVEAVYTDATTAYVEKSATATGSLWLTDDDVLSLTTQGKDIVKLNVYAKSSATSTTVTVTVDAYGKA